MANKTRKKLPNKGLANSHEKWQVESAKIRKVQISLDFADAADVLLRTLAAREHKAPSAMIREIVGMPAKPSKRTRIGVSFNDEELVVLGKRYNIDPNDKAEIRRKLTDEVTHVLARTERSESAFLDKPYNPSDEFEFNGAVKDLQTISDDIHQRFQRALANRRLDSDD